MCGVEVIRRPRSGIAWSAIVLEVFLGIGALGGGAALMLGPHGEFLPLPMSALAGSPFANYFVPGAILFFFAIGLGPLIAAALSWRRHPLAPALATVVGCGLLTWMGVEVAIVGYTNSPPLQAIYFALGAAIVVVGVCWRASSSRASCATSSRRPTSTASWSARARAPSTVASGSTGGESGGPPLS